MKANEIPDNELGEGVHLIMMDDERFFAADIIMWIEDELPLLQFTFSSEAPEALKLFKESVDKYPKTILIMDDRIPGDIDGSDLLAELVDEGYAEKSILCLRTNSDAETPDKVTRISKDERATISKIRNILETIHAESNQLTKPELPLEVQQSDEMELRQRFLSRKFMASQAPRIKEIRWGGNDPHDNYWTEKAVKLQNEQGNIGLRK